MSRCAALEDAYKSLQLEKQDWKQTRRTALREESPCANLAAQARPRAGASTESIKRSVAWKMHMHRVIDKHCGYAGIARASAEPVRLYWS